MTTMEMARRLGPVEVRVFLAMKDRSRIAFLNGLAPEERAELMIALAREVPGADEEAA